MRVQELVLTVALHAVWMHRVCDIYIEGRRDRVREHLQQNLQAFSGLARAVPFITLTPGLDVPHARTAADMQLVQRLCAHCHLLLLGCGSRHMYTRRHMLVCALCKSGSYLIQLQQLLCDRDGSNH